MTELAVTQYLTYWRSISLGNREILEGLVAPEHLGPSPMLAESLAAWDGYYYWESAPAGRWLVLVRERAAPRERWWLHVVLLGLTLLATSIGGAYLRGIDGVWYHPTVRQVIAGLPFSVPLLAILVAHESGHYVAARRYRVDASPPFFLPFPSELNLFGTLGAFIRLRSPLFDRRTLFDIGVAGPIAGFVMTVPALLIGLAHSHMTSTAAPLLAHQYVLVNGWHYYLGDSALLWLARLAVGQKGVLALHPLAVAGWVGVLVTSLNLLPLAQFDGGHIAFAVFGRAQVWIARAFWLLLIPLGHLWMGWWLWAVIALALGRGRLGHPPLIAPERELHGPRRAVGYAVLLIFLLTFIPIPLSYLELAH